MLEQTADRMATIPWGLLISATVFISGIVMILIRSGLRKPPQIATTDEVAAVRKLVEDLDKDIREWKQNSATTRDVDALGTKVNTLEKFQLALNDRTAAALTQAAAASDAANRLGQDLREIREGVKGLPIEMAKIQGQLDILTREVLRQRRQGDSE